MAQEVERRPTAIDVVQTPHFREQVELALPEGVSPKRFARIAYTALIDNAELERADPQTVLGSLLKAAADGLMPDGREAALVLFKGKAAYLPMIGGYRKIAAEHGWTLETRVVHEGDAFDWTLGDEPRVYHTPARGADAGETITHVYAIARNRNFPTMIEVMDRAEVERIRATSKAKDSGPWVEWWDRMAEKSVGRKLFKRLPLGDRDADRVKRIIDADELEPAAAVELVYGADEDPSRRRETPSADEAGAVTPAADVEGEPEDGSAAGQGSPSVALYEGEEPPAEDLLALELPDAFPRYRGKTIRDVVEAGDKRWLRWAVLEVKDERIVEAAKAGLLELGETLDSFSKS